MHASLYQHFQAKLDRQDRDLKRARGETRDLEKELRDVTLLCEGLWILMRDTSELTDKDLSSVLDKLEARRAAPKSRSCPACGRPNSSKVVICKYCTVTLPDMPTNPIADHLRPDG
ncbi:MAG: hypothetical protein ACI841_002485 [Planctomycetota bacterium]|jgi:hypothetical protein